MALCKKCGDYFVNRRVLHPTVCPDCNKQFVKPKNSNGWKDFLYKNDGHNKESLIQALIKSFGFTKKKAESNYYEWKQEYLRR